MSRSKPAPKLSSVSPGRPTIKISVDVDAGFAAQEIKIVREAFVILPPADERADFGVEGLDADFKLQRAGRKPGDDFAQFSGQAVGNHLKMVEMAGLMAREEKFEDGLAGGDIEVEGAVNELELFHAAIQQALHLVEKSGQGNLAHGNVER